MAHVTSTTASASPCRVCAPTADGDRVAGQRRSGSGPAYERRSPISRSRAQQSHAALMRQEEDRGYYPADRVGEAGQDLRSPPAGDRVAGDRRGSGREPARSAKLLRRRSAAGPRCAATRPGPTSAMIAEDEGKGRRRAGRTGVAGIRPARAGERHRKLVEGVAGEVRSRRGGRRPRRRILRPGRRRTQADARLPAAGRRRVEGVVAGSARVGAKRSFDGATGLAGAELKAHATGELGRPIKTLRLDDTLSACRA